MINNYTFWAVYLPDKEGIFSNHWVCKLLFEEIKNDLLINRYCSNREVDGGDERVKTCSRR